MTRSMFERIPVTNASPVTALRSLVLRAAEPGLNSSERALKAREAGAELADLRDLARTGGALPGRVLDVIRADRGDRDAQERVDSHAAVMEARTVVTELPTDVPGLITNAGLVPWSQAGLGDNLPLIRQLATPWTSTRLPLIPAPPAGSLVGTVAAIGSAPTDAGSFTVDDIAVDRWTLAVAYGDVARQVFDFTDEDGTKLLDGLFEAVADRGAEKSIVSQLIAAGTTAAAGTDLGAALDTAEGLAGTALMAPADLVLVNVADLPRVRRAVAASWQVDPHPVLLPSFGVPAGSVVVTGRSAFALLARPTSAGVDDREAVFEDSRMQAVRPRTLSVTVAVMRHFILAVSNSAGVRVVTL